MKFLIGLNLILSTTLGYFVYENYKKVQETAPQIEKVNKTMERSLKESDENSKLLMELKIRLQKLDKNVNGHEIGDSLRAQIGALQSDVEALEKKFK